MFPSPATYQDKGSDATIAFFSDTDNRFLWQGANLHKLGTYKLRRDQGSDYLELTYNYAREETYKVTVLDMEEGLITGFLLTDGHGQETEFRKV